MPEKPKTPPGKRSDNEAGDWLAEFMEPVYAKLGPRDEQPPAKPKKGAATGADDGDETLFRPGLGKKALADVPASYFHEVRRQWRTRIEQHRRKYDKRQPHSDTDNNIPGAGVPGSNNWVPIGPSVVRKGQAGGNPPISGRAGRIAVAPGGMRVYVASADGGVWRSDDSGASWYPTMDSVDLDPAGVPSTSLTCGAIAIDPMDPDRVYVGTGEGDVDELFGSRLLTSLPAYRGVGALVSSNGGGSWTSEPTDIPATSLLGAAFFELAVDPADRENVVAATTIGLYRREPDGVGGYHWVQKRAGKHTAVVACATGGVTTFYAAQWGTGVFSSPDGNAWTALGAGFPAGIGRIRLAARPTDPSVVYALVANGDTFEGLHRLDIALGTWKTVSGLPGLNGQASYNLALAVDPNNVNLVYMAGSYELVSGDGSIFRCAVTSAGMGAGITYSMTGTFIGTGVHADVHDLVFAPTDSSTLWTGCDGGVFRTTTATGAATFTHRNTGLATLCCNYFAQHPTQLAVAMVGLQDNGTARYTGEEAWMHVDDGDGGTPVIDWADPNNVIAKINKVTYLATDGGQSTASFSTIAGGLAPIFGVPMVTTPYNPGTPADGGYVAFGSGRTNYGEDLYISSTFGAAWTTPVTTMTQRIFALAFANSSRLFVGTTGGQVYRLDRTGAAWSAPTRIDNAAGGALPIAGLITDIEVDPADATGTSIYITFGGQGDNRHVWHYDGTQWQDRSGTGMNHLLDSSHNAIVADPANPTHIYAGADVGVWQSTDSGTNWAPMQDGLPDAAVFDLQIHPTMRILRASTHGRGMFEYKLDPPAQADVELYARDTSLDVGRIATVDWLGDPETWPTDLVRHYLSRNIKVDVPTPAGYQTPANAIDFLQFNDVIVDGSQGTATMDPAAGTVVNRVYVEVHNRGVVQADSVQVMLLLTRPSVALAPLPAGYEANVLAGTDISDANWQTVGIKPLTALRAGFPQVVEFNLPSTMLPPPADLPASQHHCTCALLHSPQDAYSSSDTNVDNLTIADRKVAQRNLQVVPFVGVPPAPGASDIWMAVDLFGVDREERLKTLVIDARRYTGEFALLIPAQLKPEKVHGLRGGVTKSADHWAETHTRRLYNFLERGRFNRAACRLMIADIRSAMGGTLFSGKGGKKLMAIEGLRLPYRKRYPLFLRLSRSAPPQEINLIQYDAKTHRVEGGNTWRW